MTAAPPRVGALREPPIRILHGARHTILAQERRARGAGQGRGRFGDAFAAAQRVLEHVLDLVIGVFILALFADSTLSSGPSLRRLGRLR
jgi:hypothetical protein